MSLTTLCNPSKIVFPNFAILVVTFDKNASSANTPLITSAIFEAHPFTPCLNVAQSISSALVIAFLRFSVRLLKSILLKSEKAFINMSFMMCLIVLPISFQRRVSLAHWLTASVIPFVHPSTACLT